ncbi:unnamed protein product [Pieris macdunnoughi]|uniref:Secreted protein n=1 Tax=Pieris macdunnoughi TaxID=345717 RepID=A0A821SLM6_9NEOP|nr:unnamed protein product [Pieris macdunnoughi]
MSILFYLLLDTCIFRTSETACNVASPCYRQERARPARVAVPGDTRRAAGAVRSTLTRPGCGARRPADVTRTSMYTRESISTGTNKPPLQKQYRTILRRMDSG